MELIAEFVLLLVRLAVEGPVAVVAAAVAAGHAVVDAGGVQGGVGGAQGAAGRVHGAGASGAHRASLKMALVHCTLNTC